MQVSHLSLTNFRNYGRLELDFPTGAILLHGDNAQGKTNLLEALYYLATTRSPHAGQDSQLLNWQAAQVADPVIVGRLVAQIETQSGQRTVEMRLIAEQRGNGQRSFRREALLNRRKVRLMDLLGGLQIVLFLPEDVQLITGSPSDRRRYLKITLCQVDGLHCRTLSQYNKVLEQRNAVLRQLAEGQSSHAVLKVYTDQLVELGSRIFARRATFFEQIGRDAQRIHYESLTDRKESLRLHYLPRLEVASSNGNWETAVAQANWLAEQQEDPGAIAQRFAASLQAARRAEIAGGATRVGPHRDDWGFTVNGRDLGYYGSRGQQRSAVLALKLAEIDWMARLTGETPVLLLDEVVAELDEQRRACLLHYVQQVSQAILTATDPGMFNATFLTQATSMTVGAGRVHLDAQMHPRDNASDDVETE